MALIKCPECGKDISDRAKKCPGCGYQLKKEKDVVNINVKEEKVTTHFSRKIFTRQRKVAIILLILTAIIVIAAIFFFFGRNNGNKISVKELNINQKLDINKLDIDKWTLVDDSTYEGTITSNEKDRFVAVVGNDDDKIKTPRFILMDNGVGTLETVDTGNTLSEYSPLGYLKGKNVDEADFSKIKYVNKDYSNNKTYSSCSIEAKFEMKKKVSGLLWIEMKNDLTSEVKRNIMVDIVDGNGNTSIYLGDLPLNSKNVNVKLIPKYFCECNKMTKDEYKFDTPFTVKSEKGEYGTSYNGSGELLLKNCEDGILIYTYDLKEENGIDKEQIERKNISRFIKDKKCEIKTFYSVKNEDDTGNIPEYDIKIIGYINLEKYGDKKGE